MNAITKNFIYKNTITNREVDFRGNYEYEYIFEYSDVLFKCNYGRDCIHVYKKDNIHTTIYGVTSKKSFVQLIFQLLN